VPEKRVKIPFPTPTSPQRDGSEVMVSESSEKWSEFTLEDGSVFRIKTSLVSAIRVDGEFDQEGNPAYALKMQPQIVMINVPDRLKRKPN
jgi:hypothetical protein